MITKRLLIIVVLRVLATVFFGLFVIGARAAQAQSETVLYDFSEGSDGGLLDSSLISDGAGNFYGIAGAGGVCPALSFGCGVVYELSPNGNGGWNETVLYNFCSQGGVMCTDGFGPQGAVIFDSKGNLYGTLTGGGEYGGGAVFELSPGAGGWTETVLYSFCSEQPSCAKIGTEPATGVIMDAAGNLYGTACPVPLCKDEKVFELSPSPNGWTEQIILDIGGQNACAGLPCGGLAIDGAGNIFGKGSNAVFELSPDGKGGWTSTVIHTFPSGARDGANPAGSLVLDPQGNLYGTTRTGGSHKHGTVYKLSPGKNGGWTETILHSFKKGPDSSTPAAGVVLDAAGNIYGTSFNGGAYGDGTVFELVAPAGKSSYQERVLWSFNGTDGFEPSGNSLTLDDAGHLYGTTILGGLYGYGVAFEVVP